MCTLYRGDNEHYENNKQLTYNRKQNKQLLLLFPNAVLKQLPKRYSTVYMCTNCILVYGSTTKGDVVKRSDYFTDMGSAVLLKYYPMLTNYQYAIVCLYCHLYLSV